MSYVLVTTYITILCCRVADLLQTEYTKQNRYVADRILADRIHRTEHIAVTDITHNTDIKHKFSPFVINKKQKNTNIVFIRKYILKEAENRKIHKKKKTKNTKKCQRHNLQRSDPGGGGGGKRVLRISNISF